MIAFGEYQRQSLAKGIFLFGLFLMAVGLPTSLFLMSLSSFIMVGSLIIYWDWPGARRRLSARRMVWLPVIFFGWHVAGLLWSSDLAYGVDDLRIKLPILLLPLAVGAMPTFRHRDITALFYAFTGACLVAVGMALYHYSFVLHEQVHSMRDIVFFTSHVRFSLELALSIAFLVHGVHRVDNWLKAVHVVVILIFVWFLNFSESATGYTCLTFLLLLFGIREFIRTTSKLKRVGLLVVAGAALAWAGLVVADSYSAYFQPRQGQLTHLNDTTAQGNTYYNDTTNPGIENHNYIWIFIARRELRRSWRARSKIPFDSLDAKGNTISSTLIRYLTSKGLRKDREGVKSLSDKEIDYVERGIPTVRYINYSGLQRRTDRLFFQLNQYQQNGVAVVGSLIQRLEYWKMGFLIAKNHPLLGVGTGDVQKAFDDIYQQAGTKLEKQYRLRAHNQYLTMWLSLGLPGLAAFVLMIFYPMRYGNVRTDVIALAYSLIFVLSCLTEDTLETQAGVTFFILFYSVLFIARSGVTRPASPRNSQPPLPRVGE